MSVGRNIRRARKAAGLSQKQLGTILGVSGSMIGQYENGLRNPKAETIVKIAAALNTNPAELDERFVIDLGSDFIHVNEDGSFVTLPSGTLEANALAVLDMLNTTGSKEWIKRGEEMAELDIYRKRKKG